MGFACPFRSTVLQCGARLPIHSLSCGVVSGARFHTGGVFECDIGHLRSVAVLCMQYKIRCYPSHSLYGAPPVPYVPVRVIHAVLWTHIGILMRLLAAEPRTTAGSL